MRVHLNLVFASAPFLLALPYAWFTIERHLRLAAGDEGVLLVPPILLRSLAYLLTYVLLWWRKAAIACAVLISAGVATGIVVLALAAFIMISWMSGVGGQIVGLLPCSPCRV